jgi:hypothetical protein
MVGDPIVSPPAWIVRDCRMEGLRYLKLLERVLRVSTTN